MLVFEGILVNKDCHLVSQAPDKKLLKPITVKHMNLGMIKKKLGENVIGTDGFDKLDNNGYEIE